MYNIYLVTKVFFIFTENKEFETSMAQFVAGHSDLMYCMYHSFLNRNPEMSEREVELNSKAKTLSAHQHSFQ
jgi:hypothetical protein